jgi:hypothetical protein
MLGKADCGHADTFTGKTRMKNKNGIPILVQDVGIDRQL